jgi:4-hydroxy-3-methylbut-2-enyl diphosphate reductase
MSSAAASLLVFAPMRIEARALRAALPGARIVRTGMGPRRARHAAAAHARDAARNVAVAGLCGALDPELRVGDIVLASQLRTAESCVALRPPTGLARALEGLGARVRIGPLLSIDHVARPSERATLRATGAIAVDMESAWLLDAARARPFAVLRVVLDGPRDEIFSLRFPGAFIQAVRALRRTAPALTNWSEHPEATH